MVVYFVSFPLLTFDYIFLCLDNQTILSPVVLCGPTDLVLLKPVVLSLQHCASMRQAGWKLLVCSSHTPPDEPPRWQVRTGFKITAIQAPSLHHYANMRQAGWKILVCSSHTSPDEPPRWQVRTGFKITTIQALSLQHFANMRQARWKLLVCSSHTPPDEPPQWKVRAGFKITTIQVPQPTALCQHEASWMEVTGVFKSYPS